ncbi:conserved hypothetical protein [Beutenbergia cavernae DSM 12333]|uniref:DUF2207 domain-containing protein n=1 Tax=Beutenbergia cavernae (strain ATCC BAA-8 / DSM 12333 / CCUG 43141 / JCM 11478 / NBRC 16432 / NCIMB 13614 / HKI 0122) TaxID=471853 RepID=C5BYB0_BEUC1|nr:DUF2207 domain-containing protein [Beutenbergia cavernae]ACQ81010.1 conserved hypothetical protein [Beutenbergia cavernae DSM 12333]
MTGSSAGLASGRRAPGRRGIGRLAATAALVVGGIALLAPGAQAEENGEDWEITRYDVTADAAADGAIDVTLDLDFDFGDEAGHGPYVTIGVLQEIPDDPDHYRRFEVTDLTASSPSGAPADVRTETDDGVLGIFVGDENETVEGVQSYVISYTIHGIVNPASVTGGPDAVYWNVVGQQWEIPLSDVSVTFTGPGEPDDVACYRGGVGSTTPCAGVEAQGATTVFSEDSLAPGAGMTIALDWPAGTFDAPDPDLVPRRTWSNAFGVTPATGGLAVGIAAVGSVLVGTAARRKGRDEVYSGLTPGLEPVPGVDDGVAKRRGTAPVAVQFSPPDGVRPGEMGTLADEVANPRDVTATIVDLAVHGYLRISEADRDEGGKPTDWRLERLDRSRDDLVGYERDLDAAIFSGRAEVSLAELRTTFASSMAAAQSGLYAEVVERGWFRRSPQAERVAWYVLGGVLTVLGLVGTAVLAASVGWGLVGLGILVVGIVTLACAHAMPARTASGSAVLAQTRGFELYLRTAEANQIRFSEGEDLFSRYLPYAIAFGVAERWAKVFADLAAAGRAVPDPTWYVGAHPYGAAYAGAWASGGFTDSLKAFSTTTTSAITAPTPGSGGSSGTGGGFSGGGASGGGGGGW